MGQQREVVVCPQSTRTREDDRLVDMFLHAYQDGRFAHQVDWLPQHQTNVEGIASDRDGTRLAVEHTKLFEFPVGRQLNPDEDQLLQRVCGHLWSIQLPVSDRVFMLSLDPRNLKKLLANKHRSKTLAALANWARQVLPTLRENREFEILIPAKLPRKERTVRIGVEVWKTRSNRPILPCCGYLPSRTDIVPLVRKAFEENLPKLSCAGADRRIMMLEVVPEAIRTFGDGINSEGAIVGSYTDTANKQHGYLLSEGNFTTIDFPGAVRTVATGINAKGNIAGWYGTPDGKFHGFLLTREERGAGQ